MVTFQELRKLARHTLKSLQRPTTQSKLYEVCTVPKQHPREKQLVSPKSWLKVCKAGKPLQFSLIRAIQLGHCHTAITVVLKLVQSICSARCHKLVGEESFLHSPQLCSTNIPSVTLAQP